MCVLLPAVRSYYSLSLAAGHDDVMFVLTRTFGDPDLFIRNDNQFPTNQFYQWSSVTTEVSIRP